MTFKNYIKRKTNETTMNEGRKIMAKDYKKLAKDIIEHIGGENNVAQLQYCMTRLRFYLKDESKADTKYLKSLSGIVTVMKASGQYQVVIGSDVGEVYEAIMSVSNINGEPTLNTNNEQNGQKSYLINLLI
ncbi:hypothetical protein YG2_01950 [Tetragenococcus halophilus]|nr:hypothetical protein YG2_01950 [Tetragenococcus halophilus]